MKALLQGQSHQDWLKAYRWGIDCRVWDPCGLLCVRASILLHGEVRQGNIRLLVRLVFFVDELARLVFVVGTVQEVYTHYHDPQRSVRTSQYSDDSMTCGSLSQTSATTIIVFTKEITFCFARFFFNDALGIIFAA